MKLQAFDPVAASEALRVLEGGKLSTKGRSNGSSSDEDAPPPMPASPLISANRKKRGRGPGAAMVSVPPAVKDKLP